MKQSKVLAFSHIPKNAGSLITYLLRSYYGVNHCRAVSKGGVYTYDDLAKDLAIFPKLRAISGHPLRPYVDFQQYERQLTWTVLLRDPYSRFPSQYKWWCNQNRQNITFEEWCELKGEKFSDFQCKWICGEASFSSALGIIDSKNVIIGFQSDIFGFIDRIVSALDIENFPWRENLVINAGSHQASAYSGELIERYNSQDILLYNELLSRQSPTSGRLRDWRRDFNANDTIKYYLNVAKHVGIYKPYKKFV